MATVIRLARGGSKKRPFYRIVVADSRSPRDGRFIEKIGTYDPMLPQDHERRIVLKEDKVKEWLAKGARPTERVHRIFGALELMPAFKWRETPKKSAPGKKMQERAAERAEKEAAVAEKAAEAAEAPAEEASAE